MSVFLSVLSLVGCSVLEDDGDPEDMVLSNAFFASVDGVDDVMCLAPVKVDVGGEESPVLREGAGGSSDAGYWEVAVGEDVEFGGRTWTLDEVRYQGLDWPIPATFCRFVRADSRVG